MKDELGTSGSGNWLDRVLLGGFVAALLLISFLAGSLLMASQVFPGPQIARAYEGGRALYTKLTAYDDVYASDLWYPARTDRKGVTDSVADAMQPGLTLYTSGSEAQLLDAEGNIVHRWHRPYSTAWPDGSGVRNPQPDSHVYFRKAVPFPNGDLLVVYEGVGDTPYGYGLVKLDRDSNVIWRYGGRTHHNVDVGGDGRIYTVTHEIVQDRLDGFDNLASARLEDYLVVLSPDGEELHNIALTPIVARSPWRHLLHTVSSYSIADPLHTNDVDPLDKPEMAAFSHAGPGKVLLSFRELGAIGVLDIEREEMTWMARGPWIGQHDPDVLPNGNILLFDNYGNFAVPEGRSRVLEFDPSTYEIVWEYPGTPERPFDSDIRSSQQRLSNGNTLITESNAGRIFEVSPDGEIVWEFVNPRRGGDAEGQVAIVCWAQRVPEDYFDSSFLVALGILFPSADLQEES